MKNNILGFEVLLSLLLLSSLFFLFDPFHMLMLTMAQMVVLCVVAILFSAYSIFLFKEHTQDEREVHHRYIGNRYGYLLGSGVLVIAIISEKLAHHSIGWLLFALSAMVIGKLFGLLYARYTH